MTDEERERFEAISEALARLVRRQQELEGRLARIEAGSQRESLPDSRPATPPADLPDVPTSAPQPIPPPAIPSSSPANLETTFGLTWLSRIAAVTVVLSLAFFFQYAIENRWITETGRVALGLGTGIAALLFGERFWRKGQRVYAQALTAAGIGFLYLSFWAAFGLYQLLGQAAGLAAMAVTTAAAAGLALRYASAAVAALALAGGFVAPLLLETGPDSRLVLGYSLLLAAFASFTARARGWQWITALGLAGTLILYTSRLPVPDDARIEYSLFLVAAYGLFAASRVTAALAAAQVLASLALAPIWAPSVGAVWLLWALSAAGIAIADRRDRPVEAFASFAGFWLGYADWAGWSSRSQAIGPSLFVLAAAFVLFLGWPLWRAYGRSRPLGILDLFLLGLNAALYFGASYALLESGYGGFEGLFAVVLAVAQMAAARLLARRDERASVLSAGAAWILLVLAAPIQFAGYRVTVAWAAEAAALVWLGTRVGDRRAIGAGFAVFLLTLGRLALADSSVYSGDTAYPLVFNARLLAFAASTAGLWAAAWWLRKGLAALIAYVAGHAVLLWGSALEAVGWAARTAPPENFRSAASTAISVLAACYALLLVVAGAAQRSALTRLLGIGLIGLVVLKLYLYDVWLLGQFYRLAAFAILGALLLAVSYLYSRFRERVNQAIRLPRGE